MFSKILPYALVVFLGYVGFSLPLPILPEMFLDPVRSILPKAYSIQTKTILLGIIMMSYPLGQLFGCPVLGVFSDRFGRKKVILLSLLGNGLGYVITAISAADASVLGIFIGFLICGFSEGNVALAQAVISDLAPLHEKSKHFGWLNFFGCLGFVIGPLLGGFLADPTHVKSFTFATPFWMAALITLIAFALIYFYSKETLPPGVQRQGFVSSFRENWKNFLIRRYFISNFFVYLGMYACWRFLPVYLQRRFGFSSTGLAYAMAYESVAYALVLLFLMGALSKWMREKISVFLFSIVLGFLLIIVVIPPSPYSLIWSIPLIGGAMAIVMTNFSVLVSNAAPLYLQGQTMGSLQAVQVCAGIVTAAGGGWVAASSPEFPLYIGGVMAMVAALILGRKR